MSKAIHTTTIATLFTIISFGQKAELALDSFREKFPVEKAYIHLDKEIYSRGETVWFKAYLYHDNRPSGLSTNFFLLLLNNKGKTILSKQYPVIGATVKGSIDLPDSLPQGNYYIKAFTPGMLNYDEPIVCTKNLFLGGYAAAPTPSPATRNISLQFFPESGNLVVDISTIVAFKATDEWGSPVDVQGMIKTGEGDNVVAFSSYHDGIGKVGFTAKAGKKYFAETETVNGEAYKRTFSLPAVMEKGINLKIKDEERGKKFQVERTSDNKQYDSLMLVVTIGDRVVYENEIILDNEYPSVIGHLLTDSLPSGILHFTVFNKNWLPLAERLSFVDNNEYRSEAVAEVIRSGFAKKQENIIDIIFPDSSVRSCSVSVIDPASADNDNRENIYSGLLLSSDLRGYIHNPGWYFEKKDKSTAQALDNLMLTHGWSRFSWKKILAGDLPEKKYNDEYYMTISGTILTENGNKTVEGGKLKIFISTEDSSLYGYEIPVSPSGRFVRDSLVFRGESKIYYEYSDKSGNEKKIQVVTDSAGFNFTHPANILAIPQKYPAVYTGSLKEWPGTKTVLGGNPNAKVLESVVVKSTMKRPVDIVNETYTSQLFRTGGRVIIDNINNPPVDKAMNGLDYVLNRITTVMVQAGTFVNKKNFSIQDHRGVAQNRQYRPSFNPAGYMRYWEMGLFINEVSAEIIQLETLRADQIAMVKLFEAGAFVTGSAYPGGAIAVYMNYDLQNKKPDERPAQFINYNGYSIAKEFYSPDYQVSVTQKDVPDNRTTLYWSPEIYLDDQTRSVRLNFYNNDFSKRFRIILEGFDAGGRLIHIDKIIEK